MNLTNSSIDFSGNTSNYAYIPHNNALQPNNLTIECWLMNMASGDNRMFCVKYNGGTSAIPYRIRSQTTTNSPISFYMDTGASFHSYSTSSGNLPQNEWHHFALTYIKGTGSSIKVYIDGELCTGSWTNGNGNISPTNTLDVVLGSDMKGSTNNGYQRMADFRLWNVIRTQDEIKQNMNTRLNGNESGLVVYLPFSEQSGTTLTDITGNGYNATVSGTVSYTDGPPIQGSGAILIN